MATKKSMWILFGILVISAWVLGSAIQVGAETLNYKTYTYVTKAESVPVGDVDGHTMNLYIRRAFIVFENGEVATQISVITSDWIKGSGPGLQYNTMTFSDGSTIIMKVQTTRTPTSSKLTREIIKGTGRFEGIRGTGTGVTKFFPVEEGEAGPKGVGEGTITYTLPGQGSKKTITLPSGEVVWDLNGEWDCFVDNYGTSGGNYPQIEKITQTGSSFVSIRMIDDPWHRKGSQSFQGELDKSGIKKVTLFAASGPEEAKGQIRDDGNKIILDDGRHRKTLTRK